MNIRLTPCAPQGVVQAPTSKSVLHRLLICAALAQSPSRLHLADRNDDIDATVRCLRAIGVSIEESSGVWTVIPPKKWNDNALLDCGESGSTLRFLLPVVASLGLSAVFTGKGRLPERPNDALLAVMQRMGPERTVLNAQCYAVPFYEKFGFRVVSAEFLEDGIPHVRMEKTK